MGESLCALRKLFTTRWPVQYNLLAKQPRNHNNVANVGEKETKSFLLLFCLYELFRGRQESLYISPLKDFSSTVINAAHLDVGKWRQRWLLSGVRRSLIAGRC